MTALRQPDDPWSDPSPDPGRAPDDRLSADDLAAARPSRAAAAVLDIIEAAAELIVFVGATAMIAGAFLAFPT